MPNVTGPGCLPSPTQPGPWGHTAGMNQIVACPEPGCEVAAEVVSRWVWPSTDGPVEHVKLFCLHGHARTMLTAWLVTPARSARVASPSSRWN